MASLFCAISTLAQTAAVTIDVDASLNRRPIDPNIYGVAHATPAELADLNVPLNRNGGNNTTRYNWQLNADNRGSDWYFQSIGDSSATAGERGDTFVANARSANAQAMLTVPMVDWVAKVGPNRTKLASFSIAKYGAQTGNDWQWFADAGNGVRTNGQFVTGNDPGDANVPSNAVFQEGWVRHLVGRWGTHANGGVRYYILDNEPSLWHATHRDVHPAGATMEEVRNRMLDFAGRIKAVDPTALVAGPEEWGWSGYLFSGADQQYGSTNGWSFLPDRSNHGGMDYLPWLLQALQQRHSATGQRLLDIFTVHYYPQGGEFSNDVSSAMQLRRNRSTRSLWDPAYVDESWIGDRVQLIRRLKNWVALYYAGTPIGITEYNWGAEAHVNGATAQADIFGIFGREGLEHGCALGDAGVEHADLQSDEDVSQLRRQQIHVRRDQHRRHHTRSGHDGRLRGGAVRRRGDGDGDQQESLSEHAGNDQSGERAASRLGAGLAADQREHDRSSCERRGERSAPHRHAPASEHHAVRDRSGRRAAWGAELT